jgi:hypothetical protein
LRHFLKIATLSVTLLSSIAITAAPSNAQVQVNAQVQGGLSKVKTVWVILMENHNWTGNNSGAASGTPDIKGSPLAPYSMGLF